MKNKWIIIVLIAVCISCSKSKVKDEVYLNKIELMSRNDFNWLDKLSIDKCIVIESSKESIFAHIDKIIIKNGVIFILDRKITKSIYKFDIEGNFVRKWTIGRGPGQFIDAEDFYVHDGADSISVLSTIGNKLITYNVKNGEFISEKDLPIGARRFTYIDNSIVYEVNPRVGYHIIIESEGQNFNKQISFPVYNSDTIPLLYGFNNNHIVTRLFPLDTVIYEISENSSIPKYSLKLNDNSILMGNNSILDYKNNTIEMLRHWTIDKFVILKYVLDGKSVLTIYDRNNKKSYSTVFENIMDGDKLLAAFFSNIIGVANDQLIVMVEAHDIVHFKALVNLIGDISISENMKNNINKIRKFSSEVNPQGNPILLLINLNDLDM